MNKWLIPAGSLTAIVVAVVVALFVAGVFDSDSTSADRNSDGSAEGDAARCAEGAEDCDDTGEDTGGDALGVCIAEDDPLYDPEQPCNDTVVSDDGEDSMNMCVEGVSDCGDMVVEPCGGDDPAVCDAGEDAAVEAAFAALARMGGPPADQVSVTETHSVEWSNACLGVEQPDVACAEVITPGFIVVLDTGILAYEFHTDTNGNAILAAPAE